VQLRLLDGQDVELWRAVTNADNRPLLVARRTYSTYGGS
jgi:hypothetical protein